MSIVRYHVLTKYIVYLLIAAVNTELITHFIVHNIHFIALFSFNMP